MLTPRMRRFALLVLGMAAFLVFGVLTPLRFGLASCSSCTAPCSCGCAGTSPGTRGTDQLHPTKKGDTMTTQSNNQTDLQTTPIVPYTPVPYHPLDAGLIEKALTVGDVAKMDSPTRVQFYRALCASTGLNVLSRPFILLKTQSGELHWYCTVAACEQLRRLHRVSTKILSREFLDAELYAVMVEVSTPDGRREEAQAVVAMGSLKGVERANALMRCESKAKRRATLAICGLGLAMADEEVSGQVVTFDAQTGNVELPPEPEEAATLLTTVGQWFRQRPQHARETIAQGIWQTEMRQIPHLSQENLEFGWHLLDQGHATLDWTSDTLAADIAMWRQAHAQQAVNDIFGEEGP